MVKLLLIVLISTVSFAYNLSEEQIEKLKVGYETGKTIVANDGTTFENTLAAMAGVESTWGVNIIGDKYDNNGRLKSLYESSLGVYQIKLSTAKLTIRKHPELLKKYGNLLYDGNSVYLKYEENKEKLDYYKSVLENPKWLLRKIKGELKAIKTMNWAQREYNNHKKIHNELSRKGHRDVKLINKLLTNHKFSAVIAGYYLRDMYNYVIKKGWSKPYKRAVGRYNGGWNNMTYANKVIKKMNIVKSVINN